MIIITAHARERMEKYGLSEELIFDCLMNPALIIGGYDGRKIAQKLLNDYVLRVVYEETDGFYVVVTAYKTKRDRYEIQI